MTANRLTDFADNELRRPCAAFTAGSLTVPLAISHRMRNDFLLCAQWFSSYIDG